MNNETITPKQKEQEALEKHGWYGHFLTTGEYPETPDLINCHTHGLPQSLGHLDLQIVFDISMNTAMNIFAYYVEEIKNGLKIEDGQRVPINDNHSALFKMFRETGRDVLRIIIPDKQGLYPHEPGCHPNFAKQYTVFAEGEKEVPADPQPTDIDIENIYMNMGLENGIEVSVIPTSGEIILINGQEAKGQVIAVKIISGPYKGERLWFDFFGLLISDSTDTDKLLKNSFRPVVYLLGNKALEKSAIVSFQFMEKEGEPTDESISQ